MAGPVKYDPPMLRPPIAIRHDAGLKLRLLLGALGLAAGLGTVGCIERRGGDDTQGALDGSPSPDPEDAAPGGADAATADSGGARDLSPDFSPASNDPFDPASCTDTALSGAQALTLLGGAARLKLADATLLRRTRTCTGMTADTCAAWGTPVTHTQALLTYSGGVVTDYKTFSFATHLILFAQAGVPKLSIRHESDYRHSATSDSRGVVFPFGADPMENSYPIIYVWDFAPAPNRYDDLQGLLGDKGRLHAAAHCARVVFPSGVTTEIAALYRY